MRTFKNMMICCNCQFIVIVSSYVSKHSVLIADPVFFRMVSLMESSHWKSKKNFFITMDVIAVTVILGPNHRLLVVKLKFNIQKNHIVTIFLTNSRLATTNELDYIKS